MSELCVSIKSNTCYKNATKSQNQHVKLTMLIKINVFKKSGESLPVIKKKINQ